MSPSARIPQKEYNSLDKDQQDLIDHLFELPDGLSNETIDSISTLIKHNKYPWGCSRLIWIPKPGTTKQRPLTIPPFVDRMVQEAIRMVLEAIFEPVFQRMNCSFGFRASNGVHEAMVSLAEPRNTNGLNKAIEGDIEIP
jgi:RNA-directed DNA polymerase